MQQDQIGIETTQGSMPRSTKNESRCVPSARKMDHEGRWLGIFQSDERESTHLGKMTKGKATKSGFEKVVSKSCGKRKIRN